MTPEQLREEADLLEQMDDRGQLFCFFVNRAEGLRAHAAALEELARVKDESYCPHCNPCRRAEEITALGNSAALSLDMVDAFKERAERAEAALAERDAEIARLKRFARKLASAVDQALSDDTLSGREINELLINGLAEAPAGFLEAP